MNNVLCFPYIFRGALDVGATEINEAMKLACVRALAQLAKAPVPSAVAKAAMASGVATRPIEDFERYEKDLEAFIDKSGMAMRPIFAAARTNQKRILFAEGEEERVLFAINTIIEEGIGQPIIIGRRQRIIEKLSKLGL